MLQCHKASINSICTRVHEACDEKFRSVPIQIFDNQKFCVVTDSQTKEKVGLLPFEDEFIRETPGQSSSGEIYYDYSSFVPIKVINGKRYVVKRDPTTGEEIDLMTVEDFKALDLFPNSKKPTNYGSTVDRLFESLPRIKVSHDILVRELLKEDPDRQLILDTPEEDLIKYGNYRINEPEFFKIIEKDGERHIVKRDQKTGEEIGTLPLKDFQELPYFNPKEDKCPESPLTKILLGMNKLRLYKLVQQDKQNRQNNQNTV